MPACGGGDEDVAFDRRTATTTERNRTTDTGAAVVLTTAPPADHPGEGTTAPAGAPAPTAGGRRQGSRPASPTAPGPSPAPAPGPLVVGLTEVARLAQPLALASRPGTGAAYVAEKGGRVRILGGAHEVVLDLSGQVSTGYEQGLLGLAFSPEGGRLYVNYTDTAGDTRIHEFAMSGHRPDAGSRREVLRVDQPFSNHNGGHLAFGPDGMLYIGLGDGGGAGDPANHAQNRASLLGKMLRIDPRPGGGAAYQVPSDNPFVGQQGTRPEIWALGLRNPWRYSFDPGGGLWIGDVGQGSREEVNHAGPGQRGQNYGWALREGSASYKGPPPAGHVPPVHEYARQGGACAVTGGLVYRGNRIPALRGTYVFADHCLGRLWGFRFEGGRFDLGPRAEQVASFGEGPDGEVYVMSLSGPVYRIDPG